MAIRDGQVALPALFALFSLLGCEGAPARDKPWRHAADPTAVEPDPASESNVLRAEAEHLAARRDRSHTLRIHMDAEPRHLDPMIDPSVWTLRAAFDTVYEPLLRYVPGAEGAGPGRYVPCLARSYKVAPDGREIRLELEPDVAFHDGHPMTAVDVQFSLDSARDPRVDAPHLRELLADVVAVDKLGPRSLRLRLARPNGYVLRALAEVPILPEHIFAGRLDASRGRVVGTGPYRFVSWKDGVVHLARYPGYWGEAPAIEDIEFIYRQDAAQALAAAKRGELDILPELIAAHYPEQASAPAIAASFTPLRLRPPTFRFLAMGTSKPPFDDARVRRAVALLVDRARLIKETEGGLARPIAGPIWPGGPGDGAALTPPAFDPAAAAALLDAAGWRDLDGDGHRERDGVQLHASLLALPGDDPERDLIVRTLARSGFVIEPRVGGEAVLASRLRAGDFDLAFVEWRGDADRDLAPLVESGGAVNFGGFASRRVDDLLVDLRSAWDPADRAPILAALAAVLAEEEPVVALPAPDPYGLVHDRVRGAAPWNGWLSLRDLSFGPEAGDPGSGK